MKLKELVKSLKGMIIEGKDDKKRELTALDIVVETKDGFNTYYLGFENLKEEEYNFLEELNVVKVDSVYWEYCYRIKIYCRED